MKCLTQLVLFNQVFFVSLNSSRFCRSKTVIKIKINYFKTKLTNTLGTRKAPGGKYQPGTINFNTKHILTERLVTEILL